MLRYALPISATAFAASLIAAHANAPIVVEQKNREFGQSRVDLARGDVIAFTNRDEFLHQIYVDSPGFGFDSDEQAPGEIVEVVFDQPGKYQVRCGIHPRMRLDVTVSE